MNLHKKCAEKPYSKIRDEKLQFDINREAARKSAILSGKIDKYEYLTGEEILPQSRLIEQTKFTYSPLGKAFEKQIKTMKIKKENTLKLYSFKTSGTSIKTGID